MYRRIFGCAKPSNPHGVDSLHPDGSETTHSMLKKQRAQRKKAKLAAAAAGTSGASNEGEDAVEEGQNE